MLMQFCRVAASSKYCTLSSRSVRVTRASRLLSRLNSTCLDDLDLDLDLDSASSHVDVLCLYAIIIYRKLLLLLQPLLLLNLEFYRTTIRLQ